MRSSAGIVAGLLVAFLAVNCGGDDESPNNNNTAGSANEGGEGGGGGSSTAGTPNTAGSNTAGTMNGNGGEAGGPSGCTDDDDCDADTQQCIDGACKSNDGESCTGPDDCVNNCIDDVCTSLKDDGEDCTLDEECAHTCIGGTCAPTSDVGGDCDAPEGEGGAGGGGAGGAGSGGAAAGGAATGGAGGDGPTAPTSKDCSSPLQCVDGKCLTPDGEACADNVDCINTCVANVCAPKGTIDADCDDSADCAVEALVCDEASAKCKLDLLQQCTDNGQCKSDRCICSNANCTVRTCKSPTANCLCKWSPADSATCTVTSANLNATTQDPNGCGAETSNYCNQGQCVPNVGGDCVMPCTATADDPNTPANEATCTSNGAPTGCNPGYHPNVTAACAFDKAICGGTCTCVLN